MNPSKEVTKLINVAGRTLSTLATRNFMLEVTMVPSYIGVEVKRMYWASIRFPKCSVQRQNQLAYKGQKENG